MAWGRHSSCQGRALPEDHVNATGLDLQVIRHPRQALVVAWPTLSPPEVTNVSMSEGLGAVFSPTILLKSTPAFSISTITLLPASRI
jgi:hypothetical protein